MSSINLNSLSTFWQSIKSFLHNNYNDETELWSGSSTSVTLNESMSHFSLIKIEFIDNDGIKSVNFVNPKDQSNSYIVLFTDLIRSDSVRSYIKFSLFNINSAKTTLTYSTGKQVIFESTSSSIAIKNYLTITRVIGINRVSS